MNSAPNLNKKLIYGVMIVVIFAVMIPYTGWLATEKKNRDLGEAAIGQIDTGSFMMKLFLLGGFRGIVADLLWLQAEENKRNHDWDRLATNVDLITKLQPHFLAEGRVGRLGGGNAQGTFPAVEDRSVLFYRGFGAVERERPAVGTRFKARVFQGVAVPRPRRQREGKYATGGSKKSSPHPSTSAPGCRRWVLAQPQRAWGFCFHSQMIQSTFCG